MIQALPAGLSGGMGAVCPPPCPAHFIHDRWQVLQLVKDTARALGIGEREIAVLAAHLSVLPKGPVRSDQVLVSFAQVQGILDRANCMDERRFRRGETRLEQAGLVVRKLSGNARRFPVRDGRGRIVDAYGIDLRPLFLRVPELESLRAELAEEEARRRALRSRLSARLSALRRAVDSGARCLCADQAETLAGLARLCRRARVSAEEIAMAQAQLDAMLDPGPADSVTADAGQTVRRKESPEKENTNLRPSRIHWSRFPRLAAYYPEPPGSGTECARILSEFLGFLGLTETARHDIQSRVETLHLLQMVEYLLEKLPGIGNPAAYLRTMAEGYLAGEAVAGGRVRSGAIYDRGHKLRTDLRRHQTYDRGHNAAALAG